MHYTNEYLGFVIVQSNPRGYPKYNSYRKHQVTTHGMRCTAIIKINYVRYDAKTFPDHESGTVLQK